MPRNYFTPEEVHGIYTAKTFILSHLHRPPCAARLAQEAGLSIPRLHEGFHHFFERGTVAFVLETRLQTARFLLTHSHKSIKEIALLTGYKHPKNFSTAYRRFFGTPPNNHR